MTRAVWWNLLNMAPKRDLLQVMRFVFCARYADYLYWIRSPIFTCASWRVPCIIARDRDYFFNMASKNYSRQLMIFVHYRLTCSLSVVSMGPKHDFRHIKELVYWRSIYSLSLLIMGSKPALLQVMKIVSWRPTCSLTILNIGSILDLRQINKFMYWRSTFSLSCRIWDPHITCANANLCIGARHAVYLCWIWGPNIPCAN